MTRCSSCGTRYDEVRWVPVLPIGTVRATRRSCPACTTGRLPRWGVSSDLITNAALRTFVVSMAAAAVWLGLVSVFDQPLRCLWPLLGLVAAAYVDTSADSLPTFIRRWIARGAVLASLLVVEGALLVIGGSAPSSASVYVLRFLDGLGAAFWILLSTLVASVSLTLRNREPGGEERLTARRDRQMV